MTTDLRQKAAAAIAAAAGDAELALTQHIEALAECAVGLEVLIASDANKPIRDIGPELRAQLHAALTLTRSVLGVQP